MINNIKITLRKLIIIDNHIKNQNINIFKYYDMLIYTHARSKC